MLHQVLLGLLFCIGDRDPLGPIRERKFASVFDFFFFFDDRPFDDHSLADHVLDMLFLNFDGLILLDIGKRHHPFPFGDFKQPILLYAFGFNC